MAAQIYLFPCLKDNFGVLLHDPESGATAAIDAPEAEPVEAALKKTGWRLTDILVTHHHGDHTAGIGELKAHHKCRVVAPRGASARSKPASSIRRVILPGTFPISFQRTSSLLSATRCSPSAAAASSKAIP